MARMRPLHLAVFVLGFCGVVAQVAVLREMVVTFHGNELCIGAMLGTWLFWTGLGSLGLGRLARRLRRPGRWLAAMLAVMAVLLVATLIGARCLKVILRATEGASVGQIRPFGTMLVSALVLLGPFCLVSGFLFPLACRAAEDAGGTVGTVYLLEAAGAAVGGAAYTFALVNWLGTPALWHQIDNAYWRPLAIVYSADSRYGRTTVTRQGESEQRTLYANGTPAFTYPDPPVAEGIAHLPLLEHPGPRRVLLLGGSLGGALGEILKHPSVRHVTCVELDPVAVEAVRKTFPRSAWQPLDDSRVRLVLGDGRAFLKRTAERYDVVIAAAAPPTTAQANRFYTLECFHEAARVLEPGGVFAFRASGWHDYLGDDTRRLLASLRRTLAAAFPAVIIFPGPQCTFLASNQEEGVLTYRLGVLADRMAERGLQVSHVDPTAWEAELLRLGELEAALKAEERAALNRDLAPRCYYYEAQRWSAQQRARQTGSRPSAFDLGRVLEYLDQHPAVAALALLGIVAGLSLAVPIARRRWRDGALAFSVASTGLIEMGVEFTVLLGFQVVCGYVYQYVGLVVASFMLGLAGGAWVSSRWVSSGKATWGRMRWVQACICAYPLVLLGFLTLSASVRFAALPAVAGTAFSVAALLAGVVGGLQFPLAAALHSAGAASAGALYGLDLFGSCLGALAVSSVLVPSLGLSGVCLMLSGLAGLGLLAIVAAGHARATNRS